MLSLLYHNVLTTPADGLPVAGHQVTIETFRRQVYRLRHQLLHPLEVRDQLEQGNIPRGILITFDDGAAGIIDAGYVLAEIGAAAVAFVCPGTLNSGVWFYRLADAITRATAPRLRWQDYELPLTQMSDKHAAYRALSKKLFDWSPRIRDEALASIERSAAIPGGAAHPALKTLDEHSIFTAAETGALIFANHSWSHPNLTTLAEPELAEEVELAQRWLDSSGLPTVPWFAFPRGNHDARVRAVVARFCPLAFSASATRDGRGALPRTAIYQLDSNRLRFTAKTAWEGRLRYFLWQ